MSRVIVFGLDAASPFLIRRWLDELPTFRRLIAEGTWGTLQSTNPPYTSPAWACMATGKNPAKVGIFGLRQRLDGAYAFKPPTSANRKAAALWDILGETGRRSIVMNVPDTYPPLNLDGVMVSGRPAPVGPGIKITYPPELRAQLDQLTGGYPVGTESDFDETGRNKELPAWQEVLHKQQMALEYLMEQVDWSLCFYVSMAVDGISHHFWQYLDADHPLYSAAAEFQDTIKMIYQVEDRRLAQVMAQLRPDDILLVVSDHGSAPCYRQIAVNQWLIDHGYLVLNESAAGRGSRQRALGPAAALIFRLYQDNRWLRRLLRPFRQTGMRDTIVAAKYIEKSAGRIPFDALDIDWPRTRAYFVGDGRLYLNVSGREPAGIIPPGAEYEQVRTALQQALLQATDPETGRLLFSAVHTRDELYSGPYLYQAPDLILTPADEHHELGSSVGEQLMYPPTVGGKHHPAGVFLAWGDGIRPGQEGIAQIYDIAPTILHALDAPVPAEADGRVLLDWFQPDSEVARRPIRRQSYSDLEQAETPLLPEEEEQIEAQLRALGYLD